MSPLPVVYRGCSVKFKYLGIKKNMKLFGYDFTEGNIPDVTDELAVRKLSGNRYFEAVKVKNVKVTAPALSEVAVVAEDDGWPELPISEKTP
jgi:hypothetical protein